MRPKPAPILLLLLTLGIPAAQAKVDRSPFLEEVVDLIEINHLFDSRGGHSLDQIIFWDFDDQGRLAVVDWRLLKSGRPKWTDEEAAKERRRQEKEWAERNPGAAHSPPPIKPWLSHPAVPRKHPGGGWVSTWMDDGRLRRVRADLIRETWTQEDPESMDRSILPESRRRRLRRR